MRKHAAFGLKKRLGCVAAACLLAACFAAPAAAAGSGRLVYVAGNPDLYPIEYYDPKAEAYRGVIPSLLEWFSSKGDYQFTYLRPQEADKRAELVKNRQVELVSACTAADGFAEEQWLDGVTVLTAAANGTAAVEYRLLFTSIADETLRRYLAEAVGNTGSGVLNALLIENAGKQAFHVPQALLIAMFIITAGLAAALVIVVVRYRKRLRRSRAEIETDAVTAVGNRDYLLHYFPQFVNDHNRILYSIVYFRIDTDRMRRLSVARDTDEALKYIAIILKEYTADTDILARVSDDVFVIVKLSAGDEEIGSWIKPILRRARDYPEQYDKSFIVDIHAGIYHLQAADRDIDEMLFNAAQSCGYAMMNHLDYAVCSAAIIEAYKEEGALQEHAALAFRNEEIELYLHFFVHSSTRRIVGAEALSRWIHPEKGLLMPARFIPLMEREGTITTLDYYVLDKVCGFLASLHADGVDDFFISCNLSRRTFVSTELTGEVSQILERYEFPREALILELTESEVSNSSDILHENILHMKELGVRIAIDDFGSGYSSFEDLQKYPIDGLKLDKSLVDNVLSDEGYAILEGLTGIGHHLGMTVLGEGAESREQVDALRRLHCDVIQGFYFYQPMPQDEARRVYFEYRGRALEKTD